MAPYEQLDDQQCRRFLEHVELIGRRWNAGVLLAGVRGARRFNEYRAMIEGISDRLLAQRLRELEAAGLIERKVVPTTPVLVHYLPTRSGRNLMDSLRPFVEWARPANLS